MYMQFPSCVTLVILLGTSLLHAAAPFVVTVVDEQTGRGVPLVELMTVSRVVYYTDSGGVAVVDDPALLGQKVFFHISSFGYDFPADGFGSRGAVLELKPGGKATLKIKRINIAERLYRTTGEGIYRDTLLAGKKAPIKQPLLNAQVSGQDSVLSVVHDGKIYFFWGDTAKPSYPLGLFATAGATSDLPGKGGLDPSVGINFKYFTGEDGFARAMAPLKEPGPVWLDGLFEIKDGTGKDRLFAHYSRMESLAKRLERGLMAFNDATQTFEKIKSIDLDATLAPGGHPFHVKRDGAEYIYFPTPYPRIRVLANWKDVNDLAAYEAFTCLKTGEKFDEKNPPLDRDASGKVIFSWKKNAVPIGPTELSKLIESGKLKPEETPMRLRDVDTQKPIKLHGSSVYWNEYRKKWIMIALQGAGDSFLGEVFYAESAEPEGPWENAKKIATHFKPATGGMGKEAMDLYNPKQQPFFDQEGGKMIYFEGTYTNSFSGFPMPTPRYEYNNLMYRLDLSDPRLKPAQMP